MRVLFATKLIEDRNFQPPGIYSMSAVLKKGGHETFIVDATSAKAVFKAIKRLKPNVLAISTTSGRYKFFKKLAVQVKSEFKNLFIVVGGIHATVLPESMLTEGIDAICRGEGDYVLLELVNKLESGNDYFGTKGFWFKRGDEIIKNPVAPLIYDLDSLPFGDREITDVYPYCYKISVGVFITSRGCPFDCTYCCNSPVKNLYGEDSVRFYRDYSPSRIVEEMKEAVKKYNYRRLMLLSEILGVRKPWLVEFTELYRKHVGIPFWCLQHPNLVDEERVEMLKEAGCKMIVLGIESGNQELRKNMLNRNITDEQLLKSINIIHKYGIKVQSANVLGLPGSNLKLDVETVDLNLKARVDFPDVCIFQPFPGTALADKAIKMGIFNGDFEKLPPTINPSAKNVVIVNVPHKKVLENLAFLFPLAAKSKIVRMVLPSAIKLPFRPLYLAIYKITITYLKMRYALGSFKIFSKQFAKIFWKYISY